MQRHLLAFYEVAKQHDNAPLRRNWAESNTTEILNFQLHKKMLFWENEKTARYKHENLSDWDI